MQEDYNTTAPAGFDDAVMFGNMADDATETSHLDAMPCIQIVHFDELDTPSKTETVPISVFLQSSK